MIGNGYSQVKPLCPVCEQRHWLSEPHIWADAAKRPDGRGPPAAAEKRRRSGASPGLVGVVAEVAGAALVVARVEVDAEPDEPQAVIARLRQQIADLQSEKSTQKQKNLERQRRFKERQQQGDDP